MRLLTSASVFWIAVQLCREISRAHKFIRAIIVIVIAYAIYGILTLPSGDLRVVWLGQTAVRGFVHSTFYNRDHYATYAGIGLIAATGAMLKYYSDELTLTGGLLSHRIGAAIDATANKGIVLVGGVLIMLVSILMTGGRGGVIAAALGLTVLIVLWYSRRQSKEEGQAKASVYWITASTITVTVVAVTLMFGDALFGKIAGVGFHDATRLGLDTITLRSIFDAPLLGYGYGTFSDVFPMFRDQSISTFWIVDQAHNTYLEVVQGLGVMFGTMLIACVVLLVLKSARGALAGRRGAMVCAVATATAFLIGVSALVDFSLQIQAVTLTFIAILGAGVAQSQSTRVALND